jgi:two-component system sensor histidine kinase HydH
VLEFAPSVLPRLREGMNRTIAVGSIAVLVLLSFALFLTTRAVRRGERERRAEQERRLVALGQMSSVMAHELRNPLASLKGNAQLLEEMLGDGTREHTKAALVVREAERLERLTADLLAFVRDGQLVRAAVTPASLVARATLGLPEGRVDVDLSRAPAIVQVDEARLAAALGNLVRNAVQSSPEGGRVRVRVTAGDAEGSVAIEVEDDGPGIAAGEEESIFEPFVTKRVHGTGLGLAVARRAVEQHGGTVRAVPRTGGALFRVVLPRGAGTG